MTHGRLSFSFHRITIPQDIPRMSLARNTTCLPLATVERRYIEVNGMKWAMMNQSPIFICISIV
jgi:hypothetical protein